MMTRDELIEQSREFTMFTWTAQNDWVPMAMDRADGIYFWELDGRRFIDWTSTLFNVNIGHNNARVIAAIQEQAAHLAYAKPSFATEPRARLGRLLAELTPHDLKKTFFTLSGSDATENAMKIARMVTGRQKILTRYRSYHGATFGAVSATGDPRRLPHEPGVPWIVHMHDPYAYRSPLYRSRTQDEGDQALVDQVAETIEFEGPDSIAAIMLEGYSGTNGIIQGGEVYWNGIQALCKRYGLLLILDEVLSGFGRTGSWFGVDHYPAVKPDIMVMAKGLTSGYLPLGAVTVTEAVASYFDDHYLSAGLTYSGHTLACAAAVANIEVLRDEGLVSHSSEMGKVLRAGLLDLAEQHPCVGEIRGTGLHQVIELVSDRESRTPMSAFNKPLSEPMRALSAMLSQHGLSTYVRWNWLFCAPPLIISKEQIGEGLSIIDQALSVVDKYLE